MHVRLAVVPICAAVWLVAAQPLRADPVSDFYRGKTISVIVGGTEGGG
jgi:hypothetical protein